MARRGNRAGYVADLDGASARIATRPRTAAIDGDNVIAMNRVASILAGMHGDGALAKRIHVTLNRAAATLCPSVAGHDPAGDPRSTAAERLRLIGIVVATGVDHQRTTA